MDKAAWRERIATVLRDGYAPFIDGIMVPRWFTPAFAAAHPEVVAGFRARMIANDTAGYAACANVIATLDLPRPHRGDHGADPDHRRRRGPGDAGGDVGADPRAACPMPRWW